MKICSVGAELSMQVDGHYEANSCFKHLCVRAKNVFPSHLSNNQYDPNCSFQKLCDFVMYREMRKEQKILEEWIFKIDVTGVSTV